jgi:hypothetical protein
VRRFITEGTNLFNIETYFILKNSGPPSSVPNVDSNEEISNYPSSVDLINAVKISGRTENGLGIGFLNAVTEKHLRPQLKHRYKS